jgi:hypothetical protein
VRPVVGSLTADNARRDPWLPIQTLCGGIRGTLPSGRRAARILELVIDRYPNAIAEERTRSERVRELRLKRSTVP